MKKMFTMRNAKVAGILLAFTAVASVANAQTANGQPAIDKKAGAALTTTTQKDFSVRVVDNRGTVKYLQANNGITTISNIDNSGNAVTTWQLGGQFTSDTELDFNGHTFSFKGVATADLATTPLATAAGSSGLTILVRDQGTGNVQQLLASDLVKGGSTSVKLAGTLMAPFVWSAGNNFTYTEATLPSDVAKISVYRNGAKMISAAADGATPDYSVAAGVLTLEKSNGTVDVDDYALAAGDRIEIQWVK